jgi:N-acetylmuramoyl-L-alanine amidase
MKVLSLGSSGEEVKQLEKRLKEFGYYEGKITGKFGTKLEEVVKYFQEEKGLAADGVVAGMTAHELGLSQSNYIKKN